MAPMRPVSTLQFLHLVLLLLLAVLVYCQLLATQISPALVGLSGSSASALTANIIPDERHISKVATVSPSPARYEIVVTLLHDTSQNWKHTQSDYQGIFLLFPETQDIPVTICSTDKLFSEDVFSKNGLETNVFRPEAEDVFGRIVNSHRTGSVTFLPIPNGKRAQEVPGYLSYILHNYDALPDVVIFLHAYPFQHGVNVLPNMRYVMDHWTPQQIGFLHLNESIMCRRGGEGAWGKLWEALGFNLSHIPPFVKLPCCAQFMVTRDRILLRPKWFYQQLMKISYELEDGIFPEHYWHIFFGESAILSEDREVRSYFLSNWTKPVHDAVLHNPYPNVPYSESMKPWYDKSIEDPDSYFPKISTNREEICPPGSLDR